MLVSVVSQKIKTIPTNTQPSGDYNESNLICCFGSTDAINTMPQHLVRTEPLERSNEQTIPASPAEVDVCNFPQKNSTLKPLTPKLPSSLMMMPTISDCKGSPFSEPSLTSLLALRRRGLQNMHKKFARELQMDLPRVCFKTEESLSSQDFVSEPPLKRRRFQRRNSKTPAMMVGSASQLLGSGFDQLDDEGSTQCEGGSLQESQAFINEQWESALGVAEELVRQLKVHRKSMGNRSAP